MTEDFQKQARELIKSGEGCIRHMYLDSLGNVTIGIGNMLSEDEAVALPFIVEESGEEAAEEEIRAEYQRVRGQESNRLASYYAPYCRLVLPDHEIDRLLDEHIAQFVQGLMFDFKEYESYPLGARLGLLDMAFNLGNFGLVQKFPRFTQAAREQDWDTCSRECWRRQIQDSRNQEVKELFRSCAAPGPAGEELQQNGQTED